MVMTVDMILCSQDWQDLLWITEYPITVQAQCMLWVNTPWMAYIFMVLSRRIVILLCCAFFPPEFSASVTFGRTICCQASDGNSDVGVKKSSLLNQINDMLSLLFLLLNRLSILLKSVTLNSIKLCGSKHDHLTKSQELFQALNLNEFG